VAPHERPFRGRLTVEEAVQGIETARQNANDLLRDAELLFQHNRWARASALAILAIEERGKFYWILAAAASDEPATLKRVWKRFNTHLMKTDAFQRVVGNFGGDGTWQPPRVEDLASREVVTDLSTELQVERTKHRALYVEAVEGADRWRLPSRRVTRAHAHALIDFAKMVVKRRYALFDDPALVRILTVAMAESWRRHDPEVFDQTFLRELRSAVRRGTVTDARARRYLSRHPR
jgi:AbiV family abortive infection protein